MSSFFQNFQITIPLSQVVILFILNALLAICGRIKSALTLNLVLIFYWVCINYQSAVGNNNVYQIFPLSGNFALVIVSFLLGITFIYIREFL